MKSKKTKCWKINVQHKFSLGVAQSHPTQPSWGMTISLFRNLHESRRELLKFNFHSSDLVKVFLLELEARLYAALKVLSSAKLFITQIKLDLILCNLLSFCFHDDNSKSDDGVLHIIIRRAFMCEGFPLLMQTIRTQEARIWLQPLWAVQIATKTFFTARRRVGWAAWGKSFNWMKTSRKQNSRKISNFISWLAARKFREL